jgi:hypothetical protein
MTQSYQIKQRYTFHLTQMKLSGTFKKVYNFP